MSYQSHHSHQLFGWTMSNMSTWFKRSYTQSTRLGFVCIGCKINAKPFCSYWVKQQCKILSIVLEINFGSGNQPPRSILSVYIRSTHSEKNGKKMDGDLDGFINWENLDEIIERQNSSYRERNYRKCHACLDKDHAPMCIEAMNKFILTPTTPNQHKEAYSGKIKRDHGDFEKIQVNIFS